MQLGASQSQEGRTRVYPFSLWAVQRQVLWWRLCRSWWVSPSDSGVHFQEVHCLHAPKPCPSLLSLSITRMTFQSLSAMSPFSLFSNLIGKNVEFWSPIRHIYWLQQLYKSCFAIDYLMCMHSFIDSSIHSEIVFKLLKHTKNYGKSLNIFVTSTI